MTSPPSPPNRRTRRIIVALLLVLLSLVSWWFWPRGDARFVGNWAHTEWEEEGPIAFLELSSNGMGTWREGGTTSFPFGWRVEGDHLVYGSTRLASRPHIRSILDRCGIRITPEQSFRIMEIGEDRIHLQGSLFELKLRRVPE